MGLRSFDGRIINDVEPRVSVTVIISTIRKISRPCHATRILHCLHVRGSREIEARKSRYPSVPGLDGTLT